MSFNLYFSFSSQNNDEFQNFCANFDTFLSEINDEFPIRSVVTGDFNAHSSRLWENDITNSVDLKFDSLTSSAGYIQIINKPIHAVNSSMLCIDLIFCTNTKISIFDKCHHDIINGKINIHVPLPRVYVRKVWDYRTANLENIEKQYLTLTGINLLKISL